MFKKIKFDFKKILFKQPFPSAKKFQKMFLNHINELEKKKKMKLDFEKDDEVIKIQVLSDIHLEFPGARESLGEIPVKGEM